MNKYIQNNRFIIFSHDYWGLFLILLLAHPISHATTINISVNGNSQSVSTSVGQTVQFDVSVSCAGSGALDYISGSAQTKKLNSTSEVAWSFKNNSTNTIRLTGFGVSWDCITDTGNICSTWNFDYLKFDTPVTNANKIYQGLSSVPSTFPITNFDINVGTVPFDQNYLDVTSGSTVLINEIEFVDSQGNKIKTVPSGTQVKFTVSWRDSNGNTYPQIFTVTWP